MDDIVEILRKTDLSTITRDLHAEKWTDDPVIHFYETFLKYYDPHRRIEKGVFYTPMPIVLYIINSIHKILKSNFHIPDGLADRTVTLLDPAAGTLTFISTAIKLCYKEYNDRGKAGIFDRLVSDHILEHFFAFELLVAPYAIGHFKINNLLIDLGHTSKGEERFPLYLTNALDNQEMGEIPLLPLASENRNAKEIKDNTRILIVCGNPPYYGHSVNKSNFIERLMSLYKQDLQEKNIQPLSDDYIKFIRFAQWKIEQNNSGVLGMITNNSYLDGVIHRQMRKSLLESFDLIYLLNLHGNLRRKIVSSTKEPDQNVFDIQVGTTIGIFIKSEKVEKKRVFYADLVGHRDEKYDYLLKNDVASTIWKEIYPKPPYYFFVSRPEETTVTNAFQITQIFLQNATAVKTHRDKFVVTKSKELLIDRLQNFISSDKLVSTEYLKHEYDLKDTNDWNISNARDKLRQQEIMKEKIKKYSYRPFDSRWIYHSDILITRPRGKLLESISDLNIAIVTTRQVAAFSHAFITDHLPDICLLSNLTKESSYIFPLNIIERGVTKSNISPRLTKLLKKSYSKEIDDSVVMHYIYAILYSNAYRSTFRYTLLTDFPTIPFTANPEYFFKIAEYGKMLIDIHLSKSLPQGITVSYPRAGSHLVRYVRYEANLERIDINEQQFFANVPDIIWNYKIGSYRVLEKWLKNRIGDTLDINDIDSFQRIVNALAETIKIQDRIDEHFSEAIKELISPEKEDEINHTL